MKPMRFDLICVVTPVMSGMMRCSKDLGYIIMFGGVCIFSLRMPICFLPSDIGRAAFAQRIKAIECQTFPRGDSPNPKDAVIRGVVLQSICISNHRIKGSKTGPYFRWESWLCHDLRSMLYITSTNSMPSGKVLWTISHL